MKKNLTMLMIILFIILTKKMKNKYIDIRKLFEYAANEVPNLAGEIGGIQQPRIFGPECSWTSGPS